MGRLRAFIRWFVAVICVGLILAIVGGVAGEFFIEWARERGYYADSSQKLDAIMSAFSGFVTQSWFLVLAALCLGLTVGLWADRGMRHLDKRGKSAEPSQQQLHELHERIEALKEKLYADNLVYGDGPEKVAYGTFHEAFAVMTILLKLGIPVPMMPQHKELVGYENYNRSMYRYFSAISPTLRNGDLPLARTWAKRALESLKEAPGFTSPPASHPPTPAQQGTPEKT